MWNEENKPKLYKNNQSTETPAAGDGLQQKPGAFVWDNQDMLDQRVNAWLNRDPFSYDYVNDPMYQQYKNQYTALGNLAMQDTMGQAAAMTGGYGNTYAQTAGQQTYQGYMQQLNNMLPQLYSMARNNYDAEGQQMYNEIALLEGQRTQAYNEHQGNLNDWYNQVNLNQTTQNTNYNRMMTLITETGYIPTDDELAAAGMTRAQANALGKIYNPASSGGTQYSYDTHGYTEEDIEDLQRAAGITVDGVWGPETQAAYEAGWTKDSAIRIENFIQTLHTEEEHGASEIFAWGPYTAYVWNEIKNDKTLTDAEKDYLTKLFQITESDEAWLQKNQ